MSIDRICKIVRLGECTLWAGAGMSIYAGYPTGQTIAEFLNNQLGKDALNGKPALKDVASVFEKKFSREKLLNSIKQNFFSVPPNRYDVHQALASIPFIKTIITTNFDFLFEHAYHSRIRKLASSADFGDYFGSKTTLIKLHGDFSVPEEIILTDDDYARFIASRTTSLVYNYVVTSLATSHVIIVGYSMADLNALALFDRVQSELGKFRKEWFLIAPQMKQFEINHLKSKNITFVRATGEEFVNAIVEDLNSHIIDDLLKGNNTDSLMDYLTGKNLITTMETGPSGRKLKELKTVTDAAIKISFTTTEDTMLKLKNFSWGENFDPIEITGEELANFRFEVNNINMSQVSTPNILRIQSIPAVDQNVQLKFGKKILQDVHLKAFRSQSAAELRLKYNNFDFRMHFKPPFREGGEVKIKTNLEEIYRDVSDGSNILGFIATLMQGKKFSIIGNVSMVFQFPPYPTPKGMQRLVEHFKNLSVIQNFYAIRFENFTVSVDEIEEASKLVRIIKGDVLNYKTIKGEILNSFDHNHLRDINMTGSELDLLIEYHSTIKIYGIELPVRRVKIHIYDTVVENLNEILMKKTNEVWFASKTGRIKIEMLSEESWNNIM